MTEIGFAAKEVIAPQVGRLEVLAADKAEAYGLQYEHGYGKRERPRSYCTEPLGSSVFECGWEWANRKLLLRPCIPLPRDYLLIAGLTSQLVLLSKLGKLSKLLLQSPSRSRGYSPSHKRRQRHQGKARYPPLHSDHRFPFHSICRV